MQAMGQLGAAPANVSNPAASSSGHHFRARGFKVRVDSRAPINRVPFDRRVRLQAA